VSTVVAAATDFSVKYIAIAIRFSAYAREDIRVQSNRMIY
jgi:hypothetical protein